MLTAVSIEDFTSYPGIRWRLKDPTSELVLKVEGQPKPETLQRYSDWFERSYGACFRLSEGRFPHEWLVNPEADSLAVHLAAGITALQRLGMQPVRRAQVLEADTALVRLALPSFNGTVLQAGIRLAIQLLLELDADASGEGMRLKQLEAELERFRQEAPSASRCGEEQLRFALAADCLGIPLVATITGYLEIGYGCCRRVLSNSLLNASAPAVHLASDKLASYLVLHRAGIPVPATKIVNSEDDLASVAEVLSWPLVVKPLDGSLGLGVSTNVNDAISLHAAFRVARNVSQSSVLVQEQVRGREFRLTAIGSSFVFARELVSASIVGDGKSTVAQLVDLCNQNPLRGDHQGAICRQIKMDAEFDTLLCEQELRLDSVPEAGRSVRLSRRCGRSAGGVTIDAQDSLHPSYFRLLERIVRVLQLEVLGLDLITAAPSLPWWEAGAKVLECNPRPMIIQHDHANPELRIHEKTLAVCLGAISLPPLIALAGGSEVLPAIRIEIRAVLDSHLVAGTLLGEVWDGRCYLGGELIPMDSTEKGQLGQALLADTRCGAALMAWSFENLVRYGRPCESIDLAVFAEGAETPLVEEILDAGPRVVLWVGPGLEAAAPRIEQWRSQRSGNLLLELRAAHQLAEHLPQALSVCTYSSPLGLAVQGRAS